MRRPAAPKRTATKKSATPKKTSTPRTPVRKAQPKSTPRTTSAAFERGRTHQLTRTPRTPRMDDPARKRSLDRMQDLERQQGQVERKLGEEGASEALTKQRVDERDRLRDQRTREGERLYGHLMQRPSLDRFRRDASVPPDAGAKLAKLSPEQRDAALAKMSSGERRQITEQLRGAERDVKVELDRLQAQAADDDPRVRSARLQLERLRAAERRADERYHDAFRTVRDREEGKLGHRVLGSLYSDPYAIASDATKVESKAWRDAQQRVRDAQRELKTLEQTAPLSDEAKAKRTELSQQLDRLEGARARVGLGPASQADAKAWMELGADERNARLAGGLTADRADSLAAQLSTMRGEDTPAIDAAVERLRNRHLSPGLFDWQQRTQERLDALTNRDDLTPAQRQEQADLHTAMTGLNRLSPGELTNDWAHWERGRADALAQPALRAEWEAHVADNPQALATMERDVAAAKADALARLSPKQRADFEANFELKTRFGRDDDDNLTYAVGYVPKQAMADKQIEQALGAGLHHSQPAMEIGRHFRTQEFARPQNAAAAAQWWQQFGQAGAKELMTHSGGGGLQPTYDEMLIIPTGSLMRAAGSTFSRAAMTQFGRNAAREIATNVAFDAAINTVGNAVSEQFGEKYGAMVPFAAVAATLLTGRVMRSPRAQAATQRMKDRVRQALPERLGGKPRTNRVPSADAPAPKPGAAPARAVAKPLDKPLVVDDSVKHLGADPADHIDLINRHGLQPKHNVTVDNVNYSMSDPFDIGGGRVAVLGVVDDGTTQTLRAFYRSNSQGNFRLLPAQNQGLGRLGLPGYDKGIGEHALNLPSQVDETLAKLVRGNSTRTDIPEDAARKLFSGAAPVNRTPVDYMAYRDSPDFIGNNVQQRTIAPGAGKGRNARAPGDVQLPPEHMPRFDEAPLRTYKTNTSTAGEVDAMVYRSQDGSLEYTLFKGQDGRVWVANVADAKAPITSHGVRQQAIDPGELDMPRWEYHQQIPDGFAAGNHPNMGNYYGDAWPYLRELPLIQSYYGAQNLPVPK